MTPGRRWTILWIKVFFNTGLTLTHLKASERTPLTSEELVAQVISKTLIRQRFEDESQKWILRENPRVTDFTTIQ